MTPTNPLDADPGLVDWPGAPALIVGIGRGDTRRVSSPHAHGRGQLFGSARGLLTVGVEEAVWVVPSIHAVWLPPHHRHWAASHGPFEGWSAYVAEDLCADLPAAACTIRTSGLLREAVLRAAHWTPQRHVPLIPPHERIAQVILDEIRTLPPEPLGLPMPRDARLLRIARALVEDPAQARDLEAWAAWGAVSARTVSRRFVSETGFTFTAWRQRARLMRSLEMLAAGQPVGTIALDLGYATASAFIGVFREAFGVTPGIYRERLVGAA
ncbi:AraC-like DNA-binding protein [Pseudoduganella lurida]|uniref:AraC-like DNA-binding protein n=1 Tax=Pseudoduganella lurida TaxID=1036180 RepID=A0A562RD25_9BURK|nr:helix-turn-helix transcriptional regulator [Pseudoduganella lurida]TWI66316.1 AraC-like DNA-binding protein [Pseudoduganella lurida]